MQIRHSEYGGEAIYPSHWQIEIQCGVPVSLADCRLSQLKALKEPVEY